jgi:hypothetical protein
MSSDNGRTSDPGAVARAVVVSGHLVDAPDRPKQRFPPSRVPWVASRVREAFHDWNVGLGTTIICGGARGADIIAAEEGHARGAHVLLCLALPPAEFERRSVDLPGTDWGDRFRRLLSIAEVRELSATTGEATEDDKVFARTNEWMVDIARRIDAKPYALLVWDGMIGDGPGGTSDMVESLGYSTHDPHLRLINPTHREGS